MPWTPTGEYMYNSTHSLSSALDEGLWSTTRPGRLTHGKATRYLLYRWLGGSQDMARLELKILPSPGFVPRIIQAVTSHCKHYAT
jgi:hypothetical protein